MADSNKIFLPNRRAPVLVVKRGARSLIEVVGPVGWLSAIEFVIADGPEAGQRTGLAGLAPSLHEFENAWDEYRSRVEEYREVDDGVLVLTYATGRGKASGVEIGERRANLFHLHAGKVTSLIVYWNRAEKRLDRQTQHNAQQQAADGAAP